MYVIYCIVASGRAIVKNAELFDSFINSNFQEYNLSSSWVHLSVK